MDMNTVVHVINSVLMYMQQRDRNTAWRPADLQCCAQQEATLTLKLQKYALDQQS